jgi:hypothetical protein
VLGVMSKRSFGGFLLAAGIAAVAGITGGAFFPTSAKATTWGLDYSNGCCGAPPFGQVSVTDNLSGTLSFLVTIFAPYNLMGGGNIFGFDLSGGPTISYSNESGNFASGNTTPITSPPGGHQMDGFGKFPYIVDLQGSGGSTPQGTVLSFDIFSSGLSLSDVIANASGHRFAVHICLLSGCGQGVTGFASDGPEVPGTPLPPAVVLFVTGLAGLGALGARHRRAARARA